jgi:hypothetical protein
MVATPEKTGGFAWAPDNAFFGAVSFGLSDWRVKSERTSPTKKIIRPRAAETGHSNSLLRRCYPVDATFLPKCVFLPHWVRRG